MEREEGQWNKQSERDIWDSFNDWSLHTFECIMNDDTTQQFTGYLDEGYDGSISMYIDCVDDSYDTDDIVLWREIVKPV